MNKKVEQILNVIKWLLIIWFGIIPTILLIMFAIGFITGFTEPIIQN